MSIPEAVGYAVVSFGAIDVTTISPTERGALVNWIVTRARLPIYKWTTDEEIFKTWRSVKGRDCHLVPVSISARTLSPSAR